MDFLKGKGCDVSTVQGAITHANIRKIIFEGLGVVNKKAISRAQHIQNFHLLS
jgi:hypothetical protein